MIKRRKKQEPSVKRIRGTEKVIEHMLKSNLKKKMEGSQRKMRRRKRNETMQRRIRVLEIMMENNSHRRPPNLNHSQLMITEM